MSMSTTIPKARIIKPTARDFLEFFYPVHYKLGMSLEDALRSGQLSRNQVAILWLIRSEGEQGHRMRRKDIEQLITTWFEASSSVITKALRGMARPPLSLVQIVEDPHSGREKQVLLTPKGEQFLTTMVREGQTFLTEIVEQLTEEELLTGIHFLRQVTIALDRRHTHYKSKVQKEAKQPSQRRVAAG